MKKQATVFTASYSGGKDSILALYRAIRQAVSYTHLVAYLGYGEQTANETLEVMAPQYSPDGKDLLQDLDLIDYGGDEFYLIVPRFASMEVTVELSLIHI